MKKLLGSALGKVLPSRLVNELRSEYWGAKLHYASWLKNRKKFSRQLGLKLNIGCGSNIRNGWINIDLIDSSNVFCWDIRRKMPFDANSAKLIFAEHVLEHLDYGDGAQSFLSECFRILMPGGIIRLVVPDAGRYLMLYSGQWSEIAKIRPLVSQNQGFKDFWLGDIYTTKMEFINAVFRQGFEHKYAYDAETLMLKLHHWPFSKIIHQSYGLSLDNEIILDTPERGPESLYVEAVK
jgi:predicted SAM-dependent methyltransferase